MSSAKIHDFTEPMPSPSAEWEVLERPDGKPRVKRGRDVHRVLEDLDQALADDPRLFQRSGELVIARGVLAGDAKRMRLQFAPGAVILAQLRSSSLLPRITEHVDYGYWGFKEIEGENGTTEKVSVWKPDVPSGTVLSAFLSKVYWAHIRPIRAIASTPIIHLSDGSIVAAGYDPETEYYVASNVALPPIPEAPTEKDARAALLELFEPFDEFPYELEAERYADVALTLTVLLRPVIRGNVPAWVKNAPQKNCGKSLSSKAACLLGTGQIPAANTWAKSEEEQEKMIGAAADAGSPVLFFDNVPEGTVIGGAPLDKVLTCDGANSFRVLGVSQLKALPWTTVVVYTVNRGKIGGDTDRRALVSTLIRPDVPPEKFKHDLLPYIAEQRPRLLAAAFTLIRAWVRAGRPAAGVRRLDSFEHWASVVAAMIKWAGGRDVRELVRDQQGTEADGHELALLMGVHRWLELRGKRDFTVKDLVKDVFAPQASIGLSDEGAATLQGLREAIEAIAGYEGKGEARKLDVRRFGKRLAGMRDVLQGTYRLKQQPEKGQGGAAKWTVVRVGCGGFGGFTQAPRARGEEGQRSDANEPTQPLQPTGDADDRLEREAIEEEERMWQ